MTKYKNKRIIHIIAFSVFGNGISGGDRIWIEFATHWAKKTLVKIITWSQGRAMYARQHKSKISNLSFSVQKNLCFKETVFFVSYFLRIIGSILWSIRASRIETVYSASEFLMDVFPAVILKTKKPSVFWIATWYQTAPSPIKGYNNHFSLNAFLYWFTQQITKFLIVRYADKLLVNNELEKSHFDSLNKQGKVIVVLGAVDYSKIKKWQQNNPIYKKKFDAVFQGRFHDQKGVVELVHIWKKVCTKKPNAKLIMIGDGPLYQSVEKLIANLNLKKNIMLVGYLFDGNEKYSYFAQSRLVLHPALFDSGGMAAYEAMAFGLPVIGFDLPSYSSYYPKGMIKVKKYSINDFSDQIIDLLRNNLKYKAMSNEAVNFIKSSATWDLRSKLVLNKIFP